MQGVLLVCRDDPGAKEPGNQIFHGGDHGSDLGLGLDEGFEAIESH